jgi:hypothetical protein
LSTSAYLSCIFRTTLNFLNLFLKGIWTVVQSTFTPTGFFAEDYRVSIYLGMTERYQGWEFTTVVSEGNGIATSGNRYSDVCALFVIRNTDYLVTVIARSLAGLPSISAMNPSQSKDMSHPSMC